MKYLVYITSIFALIILVAVSAEAKNIHGTVFGKDGDGKTYPLVQAVVRWLNSDKGTLTDRNGDFEITRSKSSAKLVISYIGYKKDTLDIQAEQDNLEIYLTAEFSTEDIIVSANAPAIIANKSSVRNSTEITLQGLRKAACCNLAESFVTNPSIDVSYSDAVTGAKQIELLGLKQIYTQMMAENIPTLRGLASTFGLSYIPGPWMESIQVSKGAASVAAGYESITGQINVEYKKPESTEPLFVNLYANNEERFEGDLTSKLSLTDHIHTGLLVHFNNSSKKFDNNSDGFLDQPMEKQYNIMNRWDILFSNLDIFFGVKLLNEERKGGQEKYWTSSNTDSLYGIKINTERYEIFGKIGYIFPTKNYNSLAFMYTASYHKQNSFFGLNNYDAKQNSFFAKLIYELHFGNLHTDKTEEGNEVHKIQAGLSYQFDDYNETIFNANHYRNELVPGAFAEYTYNGVKDLTLVGGMRVDEHNIYKTMLTPRFHLRYKINDDAVFRASVGKGYHMPNVYAENSSFLASSREFKIDENLKPEKAWNYGVNLSYDIHLFGILFTLNGEYYRTDFENQIIVDLDRSTREVNFYNLKGKSYSNSLQFDLTFTPIEKFDITAAYRLNDVKMTIDNQLREKPFISKNKAFLNFAYSTLLDEWKFDFTIDYNGGGRLPDTQNNPSEYRKSDSFKSFVLLHSQITRSFDKFDVYLGVENLTDFVQKNPIIAAAEPFGKYFDSSMIWGPLMGRKVYLGLRLNLL